VFELHWSSHVGSARSMRELRNNALPHARHARL
jgi:hypothetical protein